jgi:hypothetical protein
MNTSVEMGSPRTYAKKGVSSTFNGVPPQTRGTFLFWPKEKYPKEMAFSALHRCKNAR